MNLLRALLLAGMFAAGLNSAPTLADGPRDRGSQASQGMQQSQRPSGEQERAFEGRRDGRSMPLPQLERRVMPFMGPGADYLGPEINGGSLSHEVHQNGRVIWVDVDPQTGRILRRSHP